MEVEEIQAQSHKFPRIANRAAHNSKNPDSVDDQDAAFLDLKRATADGAGGNRLRGWHHSRIIRVSRASGGKDRHSKVWTSKGLRDRRVRLSVTTAIQFYDLQDRLGYDQPSKAVEWLINTAADAIAELPSLNSAFPDTPKQLSDENRASSEHGFDSAEQLEMDPNYQLNPAHNNQKSSACSSTSETSKGSGGLSLSRSEIKVNREKARVRARERAAKDKDKEANTNSIHNGNISQNATFTELLTGGIGGNVANNSNNSNNNNNNNSPTGGGGSGEPILFHKAAAPMDYFGNNSQFSGRGHHSSSGFSGQIHLGMNSPINPQSMSVVSPFNQNNQHFSFLTDHLIPVSQSGNNGGGGGGGGGDYNLNFSMSSSGGLAGFNRGTLQSNSSTSLPSLLPHHLQRFPSIDGSSNVPFFFGAAAAAAPMENHHHHHHHHEQQHQQQQFSAGFDRRLQQLYSDGTRHSDHKGKSKN